MDRQKIKGSSNIAEIGYDPDNLTLEIKFLNGKVYQYWPFTLKKFRAFNNAESKGTYFAKNIRSNPLIQTKKLDSEIQS